jgi:hypothetical protein
VEDIEENNWSNKLFKGQTAVINNNQKNNKLWAEIAVSTLITNNGKI